MQSLSKLAFWAVVFVQQPSGAREAFAAIVNCQVGKIGTAILPSNDQWSVDAICDLMLWNITISLNLFPVLVPVILHIAFGIQKYVETQNIYF
jgi:hypothetical protein